jgi:uncharacterized protein (TIGR02147 family)
MITVYSFADYRLFLRSRLDGLKRTERGFSYKSFAEKVGLKSPGFVTQVLQNKSNLTPEMAQRFAAALDLGKLEARYFLALVKTNQAQSHSERSHSTEKLLKVKNLRIKAVDKHQFEFYKHWYYSAIRSMLGYYVFDGDFEKLGKALSPSISAAQAKKAITLLSKLGMIELLPDGKAVLKHDFITTGTEHQSVAIVDFQLETMDLAKRALQEIPREQRTSATLTLGLSAKSHGLAMEKMAALRKELLELANEDPTIDRVIQVNLHAFPLTHLPGAEQ